MEDDLGIMPAWPPLTEADRDVWDQYMHELRRRMIEQERRVDQDGMVPPWVVIALLAFLLVVGSAVNQ
jgi:hypothetical protein